MKIVTMARTAALLLALGALTPVPASAQLGGFIKKQLKEKVAQAVVDKVFKQTADSPTGPALPTAGTPAAAVLPGMENANLEITGGVLDRFEKMMASFANQDEETGDMQQLDAALEAGGFSMAQYAVLSQRILVFCAAEASPKGVGSLMRMAGTARGINLTSAETEVMRPRCAKLAPLLDPGA